MEKILKYKSKIYIDRDDSNTIKGFLILLIVLGHNHLLAPVHSMLFDYLYSFHLVCFFILPCFYNKKIFLSSDGIRKLSKRLLVPYIMFFFICMVASMIVIKGQHLDFFQIVKGFIIGSPYTLRKSVGFIFLWFLPSFFSFSILRLVGSRYKKVNYILIFISIFCLFPSVIIEEYLKNILPLGFMFAIKFYWIGWICFRLFPYINELKYIWTILFIGISLLVCIGNQRIVILRLVPLFAFPVIVFLLPVLRLLPLKWLGKYSLEVYLLHVFILSVLQRIFPQNIFGGIVEYVVALFVSYMIVKLIYKIKLNLILFPK